MFGGANKDFTEQGLGRTRGDINILLCGDPGTSKVSILILLNPSFFIIIIIIEIFIFLFVFCLDIWLLFSYY